MLLERNRQGRRSHDRLARAGQSAVGVHRHGDADLRAARPLQLQQRQADHRVVIPRVSAVALLHQRDDQLAQQPTDVDRTWLSKVAAKAGRR
jgi:hypothetical protein